MAVGSLTVWAADDARVQVAADPLAGLEAVEKALMESEIPRLAVQRQGLDISLKQHASYRLYDITGRSNWEGSVPLHAWLSMLYVPEKWEHAPLFPVDHPKLAKFLGKPFKSRLSPADITPELVRRLSLAVRLFSFLDHTLYRQLLDIPSKGLEGMTRDEFAALVLRAARLQEVNTTLDQQGAKINTEQYLSMRYQFEIEIGASKQLPTASWQQLKEALPGLEPMADQVYVATQLGLVPHELVINYLGMAISGAAGSPLEMQNLLNDLINLGTVTVDMKQASQRLQQRISAYNSRYDDFALVPIPGSLDGVWKSPPAMNGISSTISAPAIDLHNALHSAYREKNPSDLLQASRAFLSTARHVPEYTTDSRRLASYYYTIGKPFALAALLYIGAAICFGLGMRNSAEGNLYKAAWVLTLAAFATHAFGIGARVFIMQRAPVSNIWESIIWVSWGATLFGGWLEWRFRGAFAGFLTAIGGFLVLFSASILPNDMEQVSPLRAVLNSSWLTYHVLAITLSYAAFLISALFALVLLLRESPAGGIVRRVTPDTLTLELFVYRAIQIGYPLLAWGIFSGAVWADHAWGRFWAWDPKETWSLITWLLYTIFLHLRLRHGLSGSTLAWASLIGFAGVLITWLGVSYLPIFAGLHSYANG